MAKWGEIKCPRCAELEAKLRKSALQELSALGQASEAYQAQLAAEAALDRVRAAERTMRPIGTAPKDGTHILVAPYGDLTDLQVSWFIEGEDRWANWSWSVEPSHWFALPLIPKGEE